MRKILLLLFSLSTIILNAQEWRKIFWLGQSTNAGFVCEDYDKGYILTGNLSYRYGLVLKTDVNGNQLWNLQFGDGIQETKIGRLSKTKDNGYILCGATRVFSGKDDPFIMKLNACGEKEWCRVLNLDNTGDGSNGVAQLSDGGYILFSTFYGNGPHDRFHLLKFDSIGNIQWNKICNGDSLVWSELPRSLIVDSANFLITAFCWYPNWMKPYFIQTDTAGNETWTLVFGGTQSNFVGDAWTSVRDKNGNYYAAGSRDPAAELMKFSSSGEQLMSRDYYANAYSAASSNLLMYNDTNLIIDIGWTYNVTNHFLALFKIDTLGVVYDSVFLPNPNSSSVRNLIKTFDDKILAITSDINGTQARIGLMKYTSSLDYDSVYTRHFTYDSLCPDTIVSKIISLDCDVLTAIKDPQKEPDLGKMKIFPNPADEKVTIDIPENLIVQNAMQGLNSSTVHYKWSKTSLEIFDMNGKCVFSKNVPKEQHQSEINTSQWSSGVYHARLLFNSKIVAEETFIVR